MPENQGALDVRANGDIAGRHRGITGGFVNQDTAGKRAIDRSPINGEVKRL
jgi:hypothetical protein